MVRSITPIYNEIVYINPVLFIVNKTQWDIFMGVVDLLSCLLINSTESRYVSVVLKLPVISSWKFQANG